MKIRFVSVVYILTALLLLPLVSCNQTARKGWKLVWSDEFSKAGRPDGKKWTVLEKRPKFVNSEDQAYMDRPENVRVEGGNLIIEARKDGYKGFAYTSGRVDTFMGGKWTYGRIEVRAKLPKGTGTWPAIWMLPMRNLNDSLGWPTSGEIDIMEHVGFDPGVIHSTIHCAAYNHPQGNQKQATFKLDDPFDTFHIYAVEWFPDRMDFYVDENKIFTYENDFTDYKTWPFDKEFYLILNVAVGGTWGGMQGIDDTAFPAAMVVDYVRVYEKVQ